MFAPLTLEAKSPVAQHSKTAKPTLNANIDATYADERDSESTTGLGWDLSRIAIYSSAEGQPQVSRSPASRRIRSLQPKLKVGAVNDPLEHEADRVADQVMRSADPRATMTSAPPQISRKCESCEEEDKELRRKPAGPQADGVEASSQVHEVLRSPGRPLDSATRAFFEPRFGYDFSDVRIHTDARAAESARTVSALAYTVGDHVAFGAGRYDPGTDEGRRLLGHELTHTVQQSSRSSSYADARLLQRAPDGPSALERFPATKFPFPSTHDANDTELYFGHWTKGCPGGCHQPDEQSRFFPHPVQHERVTESKLVEWAVARVWATTVGKESPRKTELFHLLQLREDKKIDARWDSERETIIATVAPTLYEDLRNPIFIGSDSARTNWSKYLNSNWKKVTAGLDQSAVDLLVKEIGEILHSHNIPHGASLVKDPATIRRIEVSPDRETISYERLGRNVYRVGSEWQGKRIKSIATYLKLSFEVIGHEGIYFEMSPTDFFKSDPLLGETASQIGRNTKFGQVLGGFVKGFLTALASPGLIALDTTAKVIDTATLAASALGRARGWYEIGWTCVSSTCRNFEACVKSDQAPERCKEGALTAAIEEATIIVPLYRQGRDCVVNEDAEACGAIAALSLGLAGERLGRLSKNELGPAGGAPRGGQTLTGAEFEKTAIREAIGRSQAGDLSIGKALDEPKTSTKSPQLPQKQYEISSLESAPITGPSFADVSSELGLEAPGTVTYRSTAKAAQGARSAGLETATRPGFQTHATASAVRKAFNLSGKIWQSAHVVPQTVYRALRASGLRIGARGVEISEGRALTTLLPEEAHAAFDRVWVREWNSAVAAGRTIRAQDVFTWVSDAINAVNDGVINAEVKAAINGRLYSELYTDLGLKANDVIIAGRP